MPVKKPACAPATGKVGRTCRFRFLHPAGLHVAFQYDTAVTSTDMAFVLVAADGFLVEVADYAYGFAIVALCGGLKTFYRA